MHADLRHYGCRRFEREHGNVVVRLSTDPAREPLRQFLVATVHSCQELWDLCCRLGLPRTSALTKAPFSQCALPPTSPPLATRLCTYCVLGGRERQPCPALTCRGT